MTMGQFIKKVTNFGQVIVLGNQHLSGQKQNMRVLRNK